MPVKDKKTAPPVCAACQGGLTSVRCERAPNPVAFWTSCSRSRKTPGHGLRLSWPRPNDHRRAVVAKTSPSSQLAAQIQISDARFVHTSHWDVELYHSLTRALPIRNQCFLGVSSFWNPANLQAPDRDLLDYFCCVASRSLATFGHHTTLLANVLLRIALHGTSATVAAALPALLAFASIHRYGLQAQGLELKIAALGSLAKAAIAPRLEAEAALQHVATGMLLCACEVYQSSCTLGQWTFHLGGVKTVLNATSVESIRQLGSDAVVLLDWVYYHDVLARFSLLHWKREGAPELRSTPMDLVCSQTSHLPSPIFMMLNLLSQVCDAVSTRAVPPEPTGNIDEYKTFLKVLDWRIRTLPIDQISEYPQYPSAEDKTLVVHLYQLAILIFFNRSFDGLIDHHSRTQQYLDKAFAILPRLGACTPNFPIHVIGCEARTDEQRAVVLDVISRTEKNPSSRSLNYCKGILQAVWAQDDLAGWNNINYREKLTSVISHYLVVPSFV